MTDFLARLVSSAAGAVAPPRPIAPPRQSTHSPGAIGLARPTQESSDLDVVEAFPKLAPAPLPQLRTVVAAPDPVAIPGARATTFGEAGDVRVDSRPRSMAQSIEAPRRSVLRAVDSPPAATEPLTKPPAPALSSASERPAEDRPISARRDRLRSEPEAAAPPSVAATPLVVEHRGTPFRPGRPEPSIVPVEMVPARLARRIAENESDAVPDGAPRGSTAARERGGPTPAIARPSVDEALAEPPVVHVTIGRIEVRAMVEAPAPVRAAPAPLASAAPRLSLEQYLRERTEGRR